MIHFSRTQFCVLFFSALACIAFLSRCGGVNSVYYDGRNCIEGVTTLSTGAEIYQLSCANCHNPIANSTKKNRSASVISSAISRNQGGMGYLVCLSASQIQAVADALQNPQ